MIQAPITPSPSSTPTFSKLRSIRRAQQANRLGQSPYQSRERDRRRSSNRRRSQQAINFADRRSRTDRRRNPVNTTQSGNAPFENNILSNNQTSVDQIHYKTEFAPSNHIGKQSSRDDNEMSASSTEQKRVGVHIDTHV